MTLFCNAFKPSITVCSLTIFCDLIIDCIASRTGSGTADASDVIDCVREGGYNSFGFAPGCCSFDSGSFDLKNSSSTCFILIFSI